MQANWKWQAIFESESGSSSTEMQVHVHQKYQRDERHKIRHCLCWWNMGQCKPWTFKGMGERLFRRQANLSRKGTAFNYFARRRGYRGTFTWVSVFWRLFTKMAGTLTTIQKWMQTVLRTGLKIIFYLAFKIPHVFLWTMILTTLI